MSKESWILLIQTILIGSSLAVSIRALILAKKALLTPLRQSIHAKQIEGCQVIYGALHRGLKRMIYTMENQGIDQNDEFKPHNIGNIKGAMGHEYNEAIKLIEEYRLFLPSELYEKFSDIINIYNTIEETGDNLKKKVEAKAKEITDKLEITFMLIRKEMGVDALGNNFRLFAILYG